MLIIFYILALIAILSAAGVVSLHQPLSSAFCLVINLVTIAALYALLDAHFLAAAQIIVYAGAIMVLVIFVIMLLSLKGEERKPFGIIPTAFSAFAGLFFMYMLIPLLSSEGKFASMISGGIQGDVKSVGQVLYTSYIYPFEIASVLIMAAIVGAMSLAKRKHEEGN